MTLSVSVFCGDPQTFLLYHKGAGKKRLFGNLSRKRKKTFLKKVLTKARSSVIIINVPQKTSLRMAKVPIEYGMQMWRNWQTRYFEVVVSIPRVGSSPVICTKCGYGGIGRRARFRF